MAETYEPELPWVFWGDGGFGRFLDDKEPEKDVTGVYVRPLLIHPSEELIQLANITDDELTEEVRGYKCMWVRYPDLQVDWLRKSPGNQIMVVWCSFRGRETVLTLKAGTMFEWDKIRQRREEQNKRTIAFLMQKLGIATSQQEQILQNMKLIEDQFAPAAGEEEGGGGTK